MEYSVEDLASSCALRAGQSSLFLLGEDTSTLFAQFADHPGVKTIVPLTMSDPGRCGRQRPLCRGLEIPYSWAPVSTRLG